MDIGQEIKKVVKFLIVGCSTFVIQSVSYYVFSRFLMPDLDHTVLYVLAMALSLLFNYSANRKWTFDGQAAAQGSAKRYVYVVLMASLINSCTFWLGHDLLMFYDMHVVVLVNAIIPFFTFATHRLYTFNAKPRSVIHGIVRRAADSV
jgi:putative flippase GtrA